MISLLEGIDLTTGRDTWVDWENVLQNILDQYPLGTVHGVQKDAIQNSWDARKHKRSGQGWRFEMELHRNGPIPFVTMTDSGTTGLTGRILKEREMQYILDPEERWTRFESLAFSDKRADPGALGARGQGKFVFLGASKKELIVYDTLRDDRIYRLGIKAIIDRNQCKGFAYENDEAERYLAEKLPTLARLSEVGSRIIIPEPIDELIEAFVDGSLRSAIEETWWEILLKYGVAIIIKTGEKEIVTNVPRIYEEFPENDTEEIKVHNKRNVIVRVGGNVYRIKQIRIAHSEDDLPEGLRGISVQRGGMKVATLQPMYMPPNVTERIYGYVQFDSKLDRLMAEAENPNHYGFDWRRVAAREVREKLWKELGGFAREKLGIGADPEKQRRKARTAAQDKALQRANLAAQKLNLNGGGGRGTGPRGGDGKRSHPPPPKDVYLDFPRPSLPGETLRVSWGEAVEHVRVTVVSGLDKPLMASLSLWMFTDDGVEVWRALKHEDVTLPANGFKAFGPYDLAMSRERFPAKGRYRIRAQLVCIGCSREECPKGTVLDEVTRSFFLEVDPPERGGLWEDIKAERRPDHALGYHLYGERGGYLYFYNLDHPAYRAVDDDQDGSTEYLFRLLAYAMLEIDLANEGRQFTEAERKDPAALAAKMRMLMGEMWALYYQ